MQERVDLRVLRLRRRRFERFVAQALDSLPPPVLAMLDNVDVVIADEPSPEQLGQDGGRQPESLFGLYEGIPLIDRGNGYSMVVPDKITIFRGPLERHSRSPQELKREIQITVIHELGHHLGIGEERLAELGWA